MQTQAHDTGSKRSVYGMQRKRVDRSSRLFCQILARKASESMSFAGFETESFLQSLPHDALFPLQHTTFLFPITSLLLACTAVFAITSHRRESGRACNVQFHVMIINFQITVAKTILLPRDEKKFKATTPLVPCTSGCHCYTSLLPQEVDSPCRCYAASDGSIWPAVGRLDTDEPGTSRVIRCPGCH